MRMLGPAIPVLLAICASAELGWAQANSPGVSYQGAAAEGLEIRGVVMEPGAGAGVASLPISGVELKLTEFLLVNQTVTPTVIATMYTDNRGEFRFRPQRLGDYIVDLKKEGYLPSGLGQVSGSSAYVTLSLEKPIYDGKFALVRRGEMTGRVLDPEGNPVPQMRIRVYGRGAVFTGDAATTDSSGVFSLPKLQAGSYTVGTLPASASPSLVAPFTEADTKVVDRDFEAAYWPGVPDAASATPWMVTPSGSLQLPDLRMRRVSTYRALLKMDGVPCAPDERHFLRILPVGFNVQTITGPSGPALPVPCGPEALVRSLLPGSYWFAVWTGSARGDSLSTWALKQVDIKDSNVTIPMTMSRGTDISIRFLPVEGARSPGPNQMAPFIRSLIPLLPTTDARVRPDADGRFLMTNILWSAVQMDLQLINRDYYVKSILYNGLPAAEGILSLVPGTVAKVDFVIDDKPATLNALVMDGDKPYDQATVALVRWPRPAASSQWPELPPNYGLGWGGADNPFLSTSQVQMSGLAPGEYRAIAVKREDRGKLQEKAVLDRLAGQAQKVVLERGGTQNITLKLSDPNR